MKRCLVCVIVFAIAGCGSSSDYTSRALNEFRAGNGSDYLEKKKRPDAKKFAALQKSVKPVTPGSREDFFQAFRILSNQRDQDDHIFQTGATSVFDRAAYRRVFGDPESLNTKEVPNSWVHQTSSGAIRVRGHWKVDGTPSLMSVYPQKQK